MKRGFLKGAVLNKSVNQVGGRSNAAVKTSNGGDVPKDSKPSFRNVQRAAVLEDLVAAAPSLKILPVADAEKTICWFHPGTEEVFTKIPGFPHPMQQPAKRVFRMAESPGKGLGIFATRALKQGELILSERPLLMKPSARLVQIPFGLTPEQAHQHSLDEDEKCVKALVERMVPHKKATFLALANSDREVGSGPLLGIVRTNGLNVPGLRPGFEGQEGSYTAVCEHISRLNHSCSPNTERRFNISSLSFRLYAVRDIAKGEELTHSYTNTLEDAATRQQTVKIYDFVCSCPACTPPTTQSDARRKAIADFMANPKWNKDDLHSDIAKCRQQLARIEREGLEHLEEYYSAARTMMNVYTLLGDFVHAIEWATR